MHKTQDKASRLFAYPYGESNEYLANEYLPNFRAEHRLEAAFGISGLEVHSKPESVWTLPRFVCGHHWTCSEDLAAILARAQG